MESIRDLIDAAPALLLTLGLALGLMPMLDPRNNAHRLIVISLFVLVSLRYYDWRIEGVLNFGSYDGADGKFAWAILCFELLGLIEAVLAIIMLSRVVDRSGETDAHASRLGRRPASEFPTVDVFIPTYNEDLDVLEKTILGATHLDWPAKRVKVWVLDDGRRDWLRDYCADKSVGYLRRSNNAHAKAGNINAALQVTFGEFVAVFDADFVPRHNFLRRVMGWFDDPRIGIVQVPHHFYNADPIQANLLLDSMLPDDQRMFFDVMQPSRDAWDAAFCCGSCGVLRRVAVDAIGGGIPTASVTEDILSTLAMKRKGYITRFVNEKLAFGLAAESVEAFFVQRKRWLRGGIQLIFLRDGPLGPGHRLIDRLLFFPASWIAQYVIRIFGFAVPAICLWSNLNPLPGSTTLDILSYQAPFFISFFFMMRWFAPGHHVPLLTAASQCFAAFRLTPTLIGSLVKPFGTPFEVTPKGAAAGKGGFDRSTFYMALGFFLITVFGIAANAMPHGGPSTGFFPIVMCWSLWNLLVLGLVLMMCFETPRRRTEERFEANEVVTMGLAAAIHVRADIQGEKVVSESAQAISLGATASHRIEARARDYSLSGARLELPRDLPTEDRISLVAGSVVTLDIGNVGKVPATIIGGIQVGPAGEANPLSLRLSFDWSDVVQRERMIVKLFASGLHPAGLRRVSTLHILLATWRRLFGITWLDGQHRRLLAGGVAPR